MRRDWFSVGEIGAARVPTLDPEFLDWLVEHFEELRLTGKARMRRTSFNSKARREEMVFHFSLFMPAEQLHLQRTLCEGIFGRILKLGIQRAVVEMPTRRLPRTKRAA